MKELSTQSNKPPVGAGRGLSRYGCYIAVGLILTLLMLTGCATGKKTSSIVLTPMYPHAHRDTSPGEIRLE